MSVDPIRSKYQKTPWQPTVDPSSGDVSDQQSAISTYQETYGDAPYTPPSGSSTTATASSYWYPILSVAYSTAPGFVPLEETASHTHASGPPSSPPAAVAQEFSIRLGDLMAAEQTCLDATSKAADEYQRLSSVASGAIHSNSIFGQIVGTGGGGSGDPRNGDKKSSFMGGDSPLKYDPLDSEGKAFAQTIIPQMEQILQAIGNTIETMGQFTALLNNAGQMYTEADAGSAFPPPSHMQGGLPDPSRNP